MTGNRPNRNEAPRGNSAGEKPVLNEKWEYPEASPLGESERRKDKTAQTVKAKAPHKAPDTGEGVSDDSRFKKGMRLFLMKRWESALEEFLQVETDGLGSEERTELAYYLGLCCAKLERFDEARLFLEKVVTIVDSPLRVYQCRMILAYIYIITGHAEMAEDELSRLQAGGLESVLLYNTLAYSAYTQKHYLGAIEFYEKALDLDKDNPTALNSLGYVLADTGLDTLKGLRLCRKAVDKNPQNAAYLDSLGWAAYKCGKIAEAGKWMRRAMDIAPQEEEIKRHFRIVTRGAV